MRYNALKFLLVALFYIFLWLFLHRHTIAVDIGYNNLLDLSTSYAGYHSLMLHGTVYALLFVLLLMSSYFQHIDQLAIRMSRKDIIRKMILKVIYLSILFVGIYTIIHVCMMTIFAGVFILVESGFYIGALLYFLSAICIYSLLGIVYLFFYILTFSETKSLIFTFLLSTLLVVSDLILGWNTPFSDIAVYDDLFSPAGIDVIEYIIIYLKNIFVIGCSYIGLTIIFKEKDIIDV